MADVKAAPPLASASENLQNEVSQNSKPKSSGHRRRGGGGGGHGSRTGNDHSTGSGSHGTGSGGHGTGSGSHGTGNNYDNDHDNGSVGRKKKPELEHYKPGAFGGSRKPEDESNDNAHAADETPHHGGNKHSKVNNF